MRRTGFTEDLALEDIHMLTEARLAEAIGPVGGAAPHRAQRNDQVATDFRLWVRDAIDETDRRAGRAAAARCRTAPRSMPTASCPASPICSPRSR